MNIKALSNEKLCEIIVASRYLNLFKEEAILAMKELAERRSSGDSFAYEELIENQLKQLPDFKKNFSKDILTGSLKNL